MPFVEIECVLFFPENQAHCLKVYRRSSENELFRRAEELYYFIRTGTSKSVFSPRRSVFLKQLVSLVSLTRVKSQWLSDAN